MGSAIIEDAVDLRILSSRELKVVAEKSMEALFKNINSNHPILAFRFLNLFLKVAEHYPTSNLSLENKWREILAQVDLNPDEVKEVTPLIAWRQFQPGKLKALDQAHLNRYRKQVERLKALIPELLKAGAQNRESKFLHRSIEAIRLYSYLVKSKNEMNYGCPDEFTAHMRLGVTQGENGSHCFDPESFVPNGLIYPETLESEEAESGNSLRDYK